MTSQAASPARARPASTSALGDGLALSLTAGIGAVVGMISWIYVARTLPPAEVGQASAFVSAFQVIAGCTEVNLGIALFRWLPHAGRHTRTLLGRCAVTVAVLSAVVGGLFLLLPGSDTAVGGVGTRAAGVVLVLACLGWALYQQQDFVLVGLGRPWWCPGRAVLFSVTRVVVFVVAGGAVSAAVVIWSWLVPVAVCVLAAGVATVVLTRRTAGGAGTLPERTDVLAFLGPTYAGQIGITLLGNLVPLLVTIDLGPAAGAAFFLMWQGVNVVDVVSQYFASSLAGAVARDPEHAREHSGAARRRLLWLMLPALVVAGLIARPLLGLFGPVYAEQAVVLQVMLGGVALRLWVIHRLAEYQALGRGVRYAVLSLVSAGLVALGAVLAPAVAAVLAIPDPLLVVAGCYVAVHLGCVIATRRSPRTARSTPSSPPSE